MKGEAVELVARLRQWRELERIAHEAESAIARATLSYLAGGGPRPTLCEQIVAWQARRASNELRRAVMGEVDLRLAELGQSITAARAGRPAVASRASSHRGPDPSPKPSTE